MIGTLVTRAKQSFGNIPIRSKLVAITMATTAGALIFAGIGVVTLDSFLFRGYLKNDLPALARIIGDNSTAALTFDDPRVAAETLSALRFRTHVVAACLYRADRTVLARYSQSQQGIGCPTGGNQREVPATNDDQITTTSEALTISHPVTLRGQRIGTLVVIYDFEELGERIKLYSVTVLAVLLLASLVAFLLSKMLRSLIAAPISSLAAAAGSVSETKDYEIRAVKWNNDELGTLVDTFNEMLSGIQSRDADLRQALQGREEALLDARNARDSLATTLASIGDAVIAKDVAGRIVLVNRAAEALLRGNEKDMIGEPLSNVFRVIDERSRETVDGPLKPTDQTVLIARDGSEIPIDQSSAPIRDKDGRILGTVLAFRDVTAKRKANEVSRLLASIVQSSNDAIIGHSLDGSITSWNTGAERIFGYEEQETIGRSSSLLAPDGCDEMPEVLERIGRGERVEQYLAVRRRRDGTLLNVSIAVSPLYDAMGRTIGASKIARDVTEQVRATERLAALNADLKRTNERLARSNEDLERFAFIASHDFQEPLRMISIYSQLLIRTHEGPIDPRANQCVEHIVFGTQRIRELLSDLMAFAEVGAEMDEEEHELDLNVVLEKVRQTLSLSIHESGAAVTADPLPIVRGHDRHFIPLFQNLIANSIKYRRDSPPAVHLSVSCGDQILRFSVSDNGMGIEPEFHEKVFVAFKRLNGREIPGTGIGLAICQRVVERYGGRIWVESEAGNGATFLFTLPISLKVGNESSAAKRTQAR